LNFKLYKNKEISDISIIIKNAGTVKYRNAEKYEPVTAYTYISTYLRFDL